jgi:type II secretory ATPase GspE/PulE/Tfp pilus assembly ATPase PilB-like protein
MAQHLVRNVCPDCAKQRPPTREELDFLKCSPHAPREGIHLAERDDYTQQLTHGRGCSNCRETGYRGRVGIFELLIVDDPVRSKIQYRSYASEIRDVALTRGMRLLRDDGVSKILEGHTTVEEVSRVTVRAAM